MSPELARVFEPAWQLGAARQIERLVLVLAAPRIALQRWNKQPNHPRATPGSRGSAPGSRGSAMPPLDFFITRLACFA
jgi:hypothetical protein